MTNLDIAQQATIHPIDQVAVRAGLAPEDFETLGTHKAKLTYPAIERLTQKERGKLILVTAVNPTPAGEGKTTVSIGLAQGLNRIGRRAMPALREPALGPVFGVKGGACGGGYSQVLPMEAINLFFNGDFPCITSAHNLLSAMLDNSLHSDNPLGLDMRQIWWPHSIDMLDRSLREIVVGLGDGNGPTRSTGYVITPASEVMAILCLSASVRDLKERLGRITVGVGPGSRPVTASELGCVGAMAALLRDALRPNLVQTIEGGPALIHGGPFGNVAHGCSSILATQCGLGMSEYLVTEGGFGSDLGGEKFLNIVCPQLGKHPDAIVLVATVRALKYHGGGDLGRGFLNLGQHICHLRSYGPPVVVALNRFSDDTENDIESVLAFARSHNVRATVCDPWHSGGPGCEELATLVDEAAATPSSYRTIYERSDPIETKLELLVKKVYGGRGVALSRAAKRDLAWANDNGYGELPVCVAKTQMSLSDDPRFEGDPGDFDLHVREFRLSAGAGFIVAVCGDIMLMPGLGKSPAALRIDVDDDGTIRGLN